MFKVIGKIVVILGLIALGYCACKFGWFEALIAGVKGV